MTTKRKAPMPNFDQWKLLRHHIGNSWGDGSFYDGEPESDKQDFIAAARRFERWIEDRYAVKFKNPIV